MRLNQIVMALFCFSVPALAQDADGSQDHPLITRFPGTTITSYFQSDFDRFRIATGPLTQEIRDEHDRAALPPVMQFEGRVTSITYIANGQRDAPFAIFRNYERALSDAGFETIFQCESDADCGERFARQLYYYGDPARQGRHAGLNSLHILLLKECYQLTSFPKHDYGNVVFLALS